MRTRRPGQSPLLLLDIAEVLEKEGVPYAVVGAMAAAYHGFVRATLDADAVLFLDQPYSLAWTAALRNSGWRISQRRGAVDDPIARIVTVRDRHGNQVDLLIGLRGVDAGTRLRTVTGKLAGTSLRFVGAEDWVALKIFAGGPQDLEDVRGVFLIRLKQMDQTLLKTLVKRYGRRESNLLDTLIDDIKQVGD